MTANVSDLNQINRVHRIPLTLGKASKSQEEHIESPHKAPLLLRPGRCQCRWDFETTEAEHVFEICQGIKQMLGAASKGRKLHTVCTTRGVVSVTRFGGRG